MTYKRYMLTEMYSYWPPRSPGFLDVAAGPATISPGPIEAEYAKMVFGKEFDDAIRLRVLVPMEDSAA